MTPKERRGWELALAHSVSLDDVFAALKTDTRTDAEKWAEIQATWRWETPPRWEDYFETEPR